jgi:predicted deacylase
VLVPVANPIGLAQRVDHKAMGRFELDTSENFNRHYPDLANAVWPAVQAARRRSTGQRGRRACGHRYLPARLEAITELHSLRRTLAAALAHDADYVLDLHCDCEAVCISTPKIACWPRNSSRWTRFLRARRAAGSETPAVASIRRVSVRASGGGSRSG